MTKKQFIRCIAFVLVLFSAICVLCDLFECVNNSNYARRYATYRNLEEDTVDAVWIGTSGTDRYWMAPKAYEDYGMTVYALSSDEMACWLCEDIMKEALDFQNPKVFIIDIRPFTQSVKDKTTIDVRARRILDSVDFFSLNKVKMAYKTSKIMSRIDEDSSWFDISYILTFIKYHSKWSEDDFSFKNNLGEIKHQYMGFFINPNLSLRVQKQQPIVYDAVKSADLDPIAEESLYEVLNFAKEKDLKIMFIDTPQFRDTLEEARSKRVHEILDKENADYIAYYTPEQKCPEKDGKVTINLNPNEHFYDSGHTNYYGSQKFTEIFSAYLDEKYDFPDHRGEENVKKHWDGAYKKIEKRIKKLKK